MASQTRSRNFELTVLGRTLEHLGTQMYKRRDVAIAELVANCWDAGATEVAIVLPATAGDSATISITDNGSGMSEDDVEQQYLVIGRNRRAEGQADPSERKVMGRKGVGKLAGFGIGRRMGLITWRDSEQTSFELAADALRSSSNKASTIEIPGTVEPASADLPFPTGTRVVMRDLKHKTLLTPEALRQALARRFSRTVRGSMSITVNGVPVEEPELELELREPAEDFASVTLEGGQTFTWWAGFSEKVLPTELQGFTVLVHGKTAQAPPYFFGVESTASGQHGTKYLTGVIEADFIDDERDDESDRVSTDRQEVDWDDEVAAVLKTWGEATTRRLLRERSENRGEKAMGAVEADEALKARIEELDQPSAIQVRKFIRALGASETSQDRVKPLAETILRAYEYQQFHDYIDELDSLVDRPEQFAVALEHLHTWKVLESRAILEVIRGRLDIVQKFHDMIVQDAPETAPRVGMDNMHDLLADYPWLINPEWQVLGEEKKITTQLREWGRADLSDGDDYTRYDFLALEGEANSLVVIEIKRAGHAVTLEDLQQLERYASKLSLAHQPVLMAFITSDRYAVSDVTLKAWRDREDGDLMTWGGIYTRTKGYYEHYRAVLEGDVSHATFSRKEREVSRTRTVLGSAAYRGRALRAEGLGPQDQVDPAELVLNPPDATSAEGAQSSSEDGAAAPPAAAEGGEAAP